MQQKITIVQGLSREPVGISTAPVVEGVAVKPGNELVIPLDELNQKRIVVGMCRTKAGLLPFSPTKHSTAADWA